MLMGEFAIKVRGGSGAEFRGNIEMCPAIGRIHS